MNPKDVIEVIEDQLLPIFNAERTKLDRIDDWLTGKAEPLTSRATRDREFKFLKDVSNTPWPRLIIRASAQGLTVEGIFSREKQPDELIPSWVPWERNNMAVKAPGLHRAALSYGQSFTTVTRGEPSAVISTYSPREFIAFYDDPVEDEYPTWALRVIPQPGGKFHYRAIDDDHVYFCSRESMGGRLTFIEERAHDMGVTPVVRYSNELDLEGRTPGEIEPLIPMFSRINKTDYDRMLAQHFNSWKVRYATGIDKPKTEAEGEQVKLQLRQDTILTGEKDVQFGTLDETNLKTFIEAHESDIEALAAASQTPTTAFGKLINISAEGLQEARASLRAKVNERKESFGSAHAHTLRLAAHAEDRTDDAANFSLKTKWADNDALYLSQAVDALGKSAQMLKIPPELLWDRIPGVDFDTAEMWKQYAKDHPSPDERVANAQVDALRPA